MNGWLEKMGHVAMVGGVPFLFVFGLPAAMIWAYSTQPHARARTHAAAPKVDPVDEDIRKCSIGLSREKCEEAFYCASDPALCEAMYYPPPPSEAPSVD